MLIFLFCAGDPLCKTELFCTARAKHAKRNGFAQPVQNTLKINSIQLCVQFARRRATFTTRGTPLAPKSVPRFINVARRLRQAAWRPRFHQNVQRQIVKSLKNDKETLLETIEGQERNLDLLYDDMERKNNEIGDLKTLLDKKQKGKSCV